MIRIFLIMALTAVTARAGSQYCDLNCLSGGCKVAGKPLEQLAATETKNCAGVHGEVSGHIGVWQYQNGYLVFRDVEPNDDIEDVLRRGDNMDPRASYRARVTKTAGSPFDRDGDDGSGSTGADVGLPFGLVLPPHRPAALIDIDPANSTGRLTILDASNSRQVAKLDVRNGRVPFNKLSLRDNKAYRYLFTAGARQQFEGRFSVASRQTEADVKADTELYIRKHAIPQSQRDMARAKVLAEYDLRWDALQILMTGGAR